MINYKKEIEKVLKQKNLVATENEITELTKTITFLMEEYFYDSIENVDQALENLRELRRRKK